MATIQPIIGNHVFLGGFEGELVDSVTVGPETRPDEDPESNWRSLGCINTNDFQHVFDGETENFCPSPGTYQYNGSTFASSKVTLDIGLKDLTLDSWTVIVGAASLDGSQVFTPGSQGQPKKGWIKIQMYESGTELITVAFDVWCQLIFGSPTTFAQEQTEATLNLRMLPSTLNSGQLLNSAITGIT